MLSMDGSFSPNRRRDPFFINSQASLRSTPSIHDFTLSSPDRDAALSQVPQPCDVSSTWNAERRSRIRIRRDRFAERVAGAMSTLEAAESGRLDYVASPSSRFIQSPSSSPVSPLLEEAAQEPDSPRTLGTMFDRSLSRRASNFPRRYLGSGTEGAILPSSHSSLIERSGTHGLPADLGVQLESASSVDCFQHQERPLELRSIMQRVHGRSLAAVGYDLDDWQGSPDEGHRWVQGGTMAGKSPTGTDAQSSKFANLDMLSELQHSIHSKDVLILELEQRLKRTNSGPHISTSHTRSSIGFLHWGFTAFQRAVTEAQLRGHIWALEKSLTESENRVEQLAGDMETLLGRIQEAEESKRGNGESQPSSSSIVPHTEAEYVASGVARRTLYRLVLNNHAQTMWCVLKFWFAHIVAVQRVRKCAARAIYLWRGSSNSESMAQAFVAWLNICSKLQPSQISRRHARAMFMRKPKELEILDFGLDLTDRLMHIAWLQSLLLHVLVCWRLVAQSSLALNRRFMLIHMAAIVASWHRVCLAKRWKRETDAQVQQAAVHSHSRGVQIAEQLADAGQVRWLCIRVLRVWHQQCREAKLSLLMQATLQDQSVQFHILRNEALERRSREHDSIYLNFQRQCQTNLVGHLLLAWWQQTRYSQSFFCRVAPALARHHTHQFLFAVLKEWIRVYINSEWSEKTEGVLTNLAEGLHARGLWIADRLATVSMLRLMIADSFLAWAQVTRECRWESAMNGSLHRNSVTEAGLRDQAAQSWCKISRLADRFEHGDRMGVAHLVVKAWLQRCHATKHSRHVSSWLGSCRVWNILAAAVSEWAQCCRLDRWHAATEQAVETLAFRLHHRWSRAADVLFGRIHGHLLLVDVMIAWMVIIKGERRSKKQDRVLARSMPWTAGVGSDDQQVPLQFTSAAHFGKNLEADMLAYGHGYAGAALQVSARDFNSRSVQVVDKLFRACFLSLILAQWLLVCSWNRELLANDRQVQANHRVVSVHQISEKLAQSSHTAILFAQVFALWRQQILESRSSEAIEVLMKKDRRSRSQARRQIFDSRYISTTQSLLARWFMAWRRVVNTSKACMALNTTHLRRHGTSTSRLLLGRVFMGWRRRSKTVKVRWTLNTTHLNRRSACELRLLLVRTCLSWRRLSKASKVKSRLNTSHLRRHGTRNERRLLTNTFSTWARKRVRMNCSRLIVHGRSQAVLRAATTAWLQAAWAERSQRSSRNLRKLLLGRQAEQLCMRSCAASDQLLLCIVLSEWVKVYTRVQYALATELAVQERDGLHHKALSLERFRRRDAGERLLHRHILMAAWRRVCIKIRHALRTVSVSIANQATSGLFLNFVAWREIYTATWYAKHWHALVAKMSHFESAALKRERITDRTSGALDKTMSTLALSLFSHSVSVIFRKWAEKTSASKFFISWIEEGPATHPRFLLQEVMHIWQVAARTALTSRALHVARGRLESSIQGDYSFASSIASGEPLGFADGPKVDESPKKLHATAVEVGGLHEKLLAEAQTDKAESIRAIASLQTTVSELGAENEHATNLCDILRSEMAEAIAKHEQVTDNLEAQSEHVWHLTTELADVRNRMQMAEAEVVQVAEQSAADLHSKSLHVANLTATCGVLRSEVAEATANNETTRVETTQARGYHDQSSADLKAQADHLAQLIATCDILQSEVAEVRAENETNKAELAQATGHHAQAVDDLQAKSAHLTKLTATCDILQSEAAEARAENETIKAEIAQATGHHEQSATFLQAYLQAKSDHVTELTTTRSILQSELAEARSENDSRSILQSELANARAETDLAKAEMAQALGSHERAAVDLQFKVDQVAHRLQVVTNDFAHMEGKYEQCKADLKTKSQNLVDLTATSDVLWSELAEARAENEMAKAEMVQTTGKYEADLQAELQQVERLTIACGVWQSEVEEARAEVEELKARSSQIEAMSKAEAPLPMAGAGHALDEGADLELAMDAVKGSPPAQSHATMFVDIFTPARTLDDEDEQEAYRNDDHATPSVWTSVAVDQEFVAQRRSPRQRLQAGWHATQMDSMATPLRASAQQEAIHTAARGLDAEGRSLPFASAKLGLAPSEETDDDDLTGVRGLSDGELDDFFSCFAQPCMAPPEEMPFEECHEELKELELAPEETSDDEESIAARRLDFEELPFCSVEPCLAPPEEDSRSAIVEPCLASPEQVSSGSRRPSLSGWRRELYTAAAATLQVQNRTSDAEAGRQNARRSSVGWRRQSQSRPDPQEQVGDVEARAENASMETVPAHQADAAPIKPRRSVTQWRRQSQLAPMPTHQEGTAVARRMSSTDATLQPSSNQADTARSAPRPSLSGWRRQSLLLPSPAPSEVASDAASDTSQGTVSSRRRASGWRKHTS